MYIRDLKPDDFEMWCNIFIQVQNMHVNHRPDLYCKINNPYITMPYYQSLFDDPNRIRLCAVVEEKVVGVCIVDIRHFDGEGLVPHIYAHIKNIAVHENYRKQGIGKALYFEAIKQAKTHGAQSVDLKVFSFNKPAIEFYKSLGMTVQNLTMEQKM